MNIKLNGEVSMANSSLLADTRQAVNIGGFDALCRKISYICSRVMTNMEKTWSKWQSRVQQPSLTAQAESCALSVEAAKSVNFEDALIVNPFTLSRAIEQLPLKQRVIFKLHDVYGHSHKEIAERLGITVSASRSQVHQARMALKLQLKQQGAAAAASYQELLTA